MTEGPTDAVTADLTAPDGTAWSQIVENEAGNGEVDWRAIQAVDMDKALNELDLGDLETVEEITGKNTGRVLKEFETGDLWASTLKAVLFVTLRREYPSMTFEDAAKVKMIALSDDTDLDETVDNPLTSDRLARIAEILAVVRADDPMPEHVGDELGELIEAVELAKAQEDGAVPT